MPGSRFPLPVLENRLRRVMFNILTRCGYPSLTLIRVILSGDVACNACQSVVDAFNDTRGSKLISQQLGGPRFVEYERFLQCLV